MEARHSRVWTEGHGFSGSLQASADNGRVVLSTLSGALYKSTGLCACQSGPHTSGA